MSGDDRDLLDRFAALRREEEIGAPRFVAPSRAGREQARRRAPGIPIAAAACLATAIAGFLWLRPDSRRPRSGPEKPVASITQWKSSTGFLLDTPGRELLQSAPTIGTWPDGATMPAPPQKHRQVQRRVLP